MGRGSQGASGGGRSMKEGNTIITPEKLIEDQYFQVLRGSLWLGGPEGVQGVPRVCTSEKVHTTP